MAVSEDTEVVSLLWIAILVPLVFDRAGVRNAWEIMGPQTRKLAQGIAKKRGWERNLPAGTGI
jgi:hypothetical protein